VIADVEVPQELMPRRTPRPSPSFVATAVVAKLHKKRHELDNNVRVCEACAFWNAPTPVRCHAIMRHVLWNHRIPCTKTNAPSVGASAALPGSGTERRSIACLPFQLRPSCPERDVPRGWMLMGCHLDGGANLIGRQCERGDALSEKLLTPKPPTQETVPWEHRRVKIRRVHPDTDMHVSDLASNHERVVLVNALQPDQGWFIQAALMVVNHCARVQSSIFKRQRLKWREPKPCWPTNPPRAPRSG